MKLSTPFSDIAELMYLMMEDSDIFNSLKQDINLQKISDYILIGATVDFTVCRKDLEKYTPYTEFNNTFEIDTDCNSYEYNLDIDEKCKDDIVLYVNNKVIVDYDYSYDNTTNKGIIKYDFKENDIVEVVNYFEGEFEEDLDYREKYIIALAGYLHYLDGKAILEKQICKKLGDKDYSITRGNTLSEIIKAKTDTMSNLEKYMTKYDQNKAFVDDLT